MPSTPDPNYWGNPPQTPRSQNIPQQPTAPAQPAAPNATGQQPAASGTAAEGMPTQPGPETGATPQAQAAPNAAAPTSQQPANNQANTFTPAAPPAPKRSQKKNTGIIITVAVIAAILLGMGGCAACTAVVSNVFDDTDNTGYTYDSPYDQKGYGYSAPQNEQESLNSETRRSFALAGKAALSNTELDAIQQDYFNNASKAADAGGNYAAGVYYVGTDIPAGSYWLTGSNSELSYFYILKPTKTGAQTYNTVHINNYYGHNLTNLEEGEVLILDNSGTMLPLSQMSESFSSPYGSGVYRVGVDVPEGTYQLVVGDGADDYSACYVMADLNYDDDSSYLYSDYFVKGDKPETITLKAGTFVELYNMQMKPTGLA